MDKTRKRLKDYEAKLIGHALKPHDKGRDTARYTITQEEWEVILDYRKTPKERNFVETIKKFGKDGKLLSSVEKLQSEPLDVPEDFELSKISTNKTTGQQWLQYLPKRKEDLGELGIKKIFEDVLSKHKKGNYRKIKKSKIKDPKALKATTTDDHVGLEPNPKNNGLFKYEYNGGIYKSSIDKVFNSIIKEHNIYGKFDLLLIDNLGDEQDGWNGYTTRGGHLLEQNMSNLEVFECCVDTKVNLVTNVVENNIANKVILRNVTNANHSADFSSVINLAVKKIINKIYDNDVVEIDNLTRFMEHRSYGSHGFILTHGKDKDKMFKGLPLVLNDKSVNFINDYIRFYNIKNEFIHVEKGDLHQLGFQKTPNFDYRNFMSLAPPSSWVQHNFGDSYSGYSIQVIPKFTNEISHTDYFLNYKKIEQIA